MIDTSTSAGPEPALDGRWGVVGLGRAGLPLARILDEAGLLAGAWRRRSPVRPKGLSATVSIASGTLHELHSDIDTLLFALPDDLLGRMLLAIPDELRERPDLTWIHVSGAHSTTVFRAAGVKGDLGACHPLCSLSGDDGDRERLSGAFFAIDGQGRGALRSRALARAAGGIPGHVPAQARAAYHAAAAIASNGVYALLEAAARVCADAGIDDPALLAGMSALAAGSADNARRRPLPHAATGPIVRGDAGTVRAHLTWLDREDPTIAILYRSISELLANLAERRGLSESRLAAIRALLSTPSGR